MKQVNPTFSIIIPTCARNAWLVKCLDLLVADDQWLNAAKYECIVTDDGPAQEAVQLLQESYPGVIFTKGPRKGPAANRNHGASLAKGEWLIFTDDDCLPQPGWLQAYTDAIDLHPECLAFEGKILADNPAMLKQDMAECPVNENGGCFWSANIMIQKELFKSISGFDEQFLIAAQEDQDIFIRIKEHTPVVFVANAIVIHPVRIPKLSKQLQDVPKRMKNWALYYRKHDMQPRLPQKFIHSFFYYMRWGTVSVLTGSPRKSVLQYRYAIECLKQYVKAAW
jgi:GT2 family glycosyltransferase